MNRLLTYAMVLGLSFAAPAYGEELEMWGFRPGDCPSGFHHQPNGPFALVLFCEDALGTYLSVVYANPIGAPFTPNQRWNLNDRYWHEPLWGTDVTGFRWSEDGAKLLVSTHQVYGSGGLFELDLQQRKASQRLPVGWLVSIENPGPGYGINGVPFNEDQ